MIVSLIFFFLIRGSLFGALKAEEAEEAETAIECEFGSSPSVGKTLPNASSGSSSKRSSLLRRQQRHVGALALPRWLAS